MFQVICFCSKHKELNVYPAFLSEKLAYDVRDMYPGYRVVIYVS